MPDQRVFMFEEQEFLYASEDCQGRCIKCGDEAFGVEPDARKYKCESCEENGVYGLDELLMMGQIMFVDEIEKTSVGKLDKKALRARHAPTI